MKPRTVFVAFLLAVLTVYLIAVAFFGFSIALHQNHKQSSAIPARVAFLTQINDVLSQERMPVCAAVYPARKGGVKFVADKGTMSPVVIRPGFSNSGMNSGGNAILIQDRSLEAKLRWCAYYTAPRKFSTTKEFDSIVVVVNGKRLMKMRFPVFAAPNPPA